MTSQELRQKFIQFFVERGHREFPASSLIPENDPSVLFTTAGMQQFKEFYLNPEKAPAKNIVTCQPCLRTSDIEEVGDETHLTFFEMLGNFSFGGYGKKEAIEFAWEFLTSKKWLGIDKEKISVTYFEKSKAKIDIATDDESKKILEQLEGLEKIEGQGDDNFWSLGAENSPGGPTVEFYFDDIEIWNIVFNEYVFNNGKYEKSEKKGVDTGMGLERTLAVLNGLDDIYETDVFQPTINSIEEETPFKKDKDGESIRMIADHLRSSVMITSAGIVPGKNERESVLRKLIRRLVDYSGMKEFEPTWIKNIISVIIESLKSQYPELKDNQQKIEGIIFNEAKSFSVVLTKCEEIIKNRREYSAKDAFDLFQSQGCPIRMYQDYAAMNQVKITDQDIDVEQKKHREISRAGISMFKGGLAGEGEMETKYHTATHLLLKALQIVLGADVHQRGSNINAERLRFDFSYPEKLTDEQIKKIEVIVNQKIAANLPVKMDEMTVEEAKAKGAEAQFTSKYGEKVKVYSIDDFSREVCGGPHVENTGVLGHFKIIKEESSSAGVRRIKAILEPFTPLQERGR
ncbi:MAG TPA: alanine--tRNA ligase [Patescibacteria group bacterium]|nr:alanine--tRNA ligase [Patescibacteria group bacterium]